MGSALLIKSFADLSVQELYAILRLRSEVFVVEQNCVYQDLDGYDPDCLHVMLNYNDQLAAYCRLVPPGLKYPEWSIGRVITAPSARGLGLGHTLLQAAMERIGAQPIRISAQSHLDKFYAGHGFAAVGTPYMEDNIPHIEMLRAA